MTGAPARIAVTAGEPAGIGPELLVRLAQRDCAAQLVAIADPDTLIQAADALELPLALTPFDAAASASAHRAGHLFVQAVPLATPAQFGRLDVANAAAVIAMLATAADGAERGVFDALVTAPVQKSILGDAGFAFSGHTEFFAERLGGARPVMMLAAGTLRVALATTHLPLRAVSAALSAALIETVLRVLHAALRRDFGCQRPRIAVCGLNPHAGESGHLGDEEQRVIGPGLAAARAAGIDATGPFPADTLFVPQQRAGYDAILAMYHDQGLPVLKAAGFGEAVNITLGLPIVRTSVDHGTALDLAGSGRAASGSLRAALATAAAMVEHHA